jgi:asparaginyl-tRNA synthetase
MQKINVKELYKKTDELLGRDVILEGWVRTTRASKEFGFIDLNDGTFFKGVQVVFDTSLDNFKELTNLPIGSAIRVEGKLVESQGGGQKFEIKSISVEIVGKADADFPLQKKRHSFEFLRTIAHLRPRSNTFSAVFRVRSVLDYAIHKFFNERDFVYLHSPIITANDCEGAGEMFQLTTMDLGNVPHGGNGKTNFKKDFFGKKTGLTVSGQLNAETFAHAFKKTYSFGPTFRAENSNTSRHAAEFWMLEPEVAFAALEDNMDLAEDMMKYIIKYTRAKCPEEMEFFNKFIDKNLDERLDKVVNSKFERITYSEAIDILLKAKKKFEFSVKWGIDLQSEHERYIVEEVYEKPVFVINYPKEIKAFYMRMNDDNITVAAMDLLAPGVGEIIGGSQREDRLEVLDKRMEEMNISKDDLWWYRDIRKYGGVKHSGFGLGFERLIMYMTGMENIRDVIAFPRVPKGVEF